MPAQQCWEHAALKGLPLHWTSSSGGSISTKRRPAQNCSARSRATLCFRPHPFCVLRCQSAGWAPSSARTGRFAPITNGGVQSALEKLKVTFLLMPVESLSF